MDTRDDAKKSSHGIAKDWHLRAPDGLRIGLRSGPDLKSPWDGEYILEILVRKPNRCRWELSFPARADLFRLVIEATTNEGGSIDISARIEGDVTGPQWHGVFSEWPDVFNLAANLRSSATDAKSRWPSTIAVQSIKGLTTSRPIYVSSEPTQQESARVAALAFAGSDSSGGFTIVGPSNVPGLTQYTYTLKAPDSGTVATNISWTTNSTNATVVSGATTSNAVIAFKNGVAELVTITARYKVDGENKVATKDVAIVKVEIAEPGPGSYLSQQFGTGIPGNDLAFINNPPNQNPAWVTRFDPGSNCIKFVYHGTTKAAEPYVVIDSGGPPVGNFMVINALVTLTAPNARKGALQSIELGYINKLSVAGAAYYKTFPPDKQRNIVVPTLDTLDWLQAVPPEDAAVCPATGWPYYETPVRGQGNTGTWTTPGNGIHWADSPRIPVPAKYNPTDNMDANKNAALTEASIGFVFTVRVGVRTIDADNGANKHYFSHTEFPLILRFQWKNNGGTGSAFGAAAWTRNQNPTEIDVNVVPSVINHSPKFLQWIPA